MSFRLFIEAAHPFVSLRSEIEKQGWRWEAPSNRLIPGTNPEVVSLGGTNYPTIVSPDGNVKIALSEYDLYLYQNRVMVAGYDPKQSKQLTVAAIIVKPEARGKGLATSSLKWLQSVANKLGITLVAEPQEITPAKVKGQKPPKGLSTQKLKAWYASMGWQNKYPDSDAIIHYKPTRKKNS
jgi:GNAT superfamily N-acetyltransferase